MTRRAVCSPCVIRLAVTAADAVALGSGGAPAQAMTVSYQCIGYRPLTAELTPREGQIHFEGQNWTVVRVPGAHEARYVNGRAGVTVVTQGRSLMLTHGGKTLKCALKSDALAPENLGVKKP